MGDSRPGKCGQVRSGCRKPVLRGAGAPGMGLSCQRPLLRPCRLRSCPSCPPLSPHLCVRGPEQSSPSAVPPPPPSPTLIRFPAPGRPLLTWNTHPSKLLPVLHDPGLLHNLQMSREGILSHAAICSCLQHCFDIRPPWLMWDWFLPLTNILEFATSYLFTASVMCI